MFKARTIRSNRAPAVKNPRGFGPTIKVGGCVVTGYMQVFEGEPTEVEYIRADGTRGKATIGVPPEELLRKDDVIIETLTLGPWPNSAVHRHMVSVKQHHKIADDFRNGLFFTEQEIRTQEWRRIMETDEEARVAHLRSMGESKDRARALAARRPGSIPGAREIESMKARMRAEDAGKRAAEEAETKPAKRTQAKKKKAKEA